MNKYIKFIVFLGPLWVFLGLNLLATMDYEAFQLFARQERPIELIQAILYFAASIFLFSIIFKYWANIDKFQLAAILLLGFLFLFVSFEEISWGQQIFKFSTPEEIAIHNTQSELTLHNLDIFQKSFLLHSFYIIFCFGFVFSSLIIKYIKSKHLKFQTLDIFILNKYLILYFLFPGIFYIHLEFIREFLVEVFPAVKFLNAPDQEMFELMLSIGVIGYCINIFNKFQPLYSKVDTENSNFKSELI